MTEQDRITSKLAVPYHLTYGRYKRLKITLDNDGRVLAFASKRISIREIENFIEEHISWIEKHQKKILATTKLEYESVEEQKRKIKELKAWANAFLAEYDGLKPKRVTIKHMSSRWGSCSSSGNISLNYFLSELDEPLREYVFIHELSHLYQMNHSPLFWSKVGERCPDYKSRRKALKQYRLPQKPS
ncbi:MAG: DUF45 domain-containing protein [Clostridiales bacterium]|nr:DUF45 domain-containing protein [Clostridiales bacterium]